VAQPLRYFDNNVGSTLALLQTMDRANVRRIVFSSSATVYGDPAQVPITEASQLQVTNPYGRTKLMCEDILRDLQAADPQNPNLWQVAILRYFNPVGAHISGTIGEHPHGIPNNLMPFITQVAVGKREYLSIFGNDYPTPDGTGVRDYIHVVDLAQGHLAALNYLQQKQQSITVNLGTGKGVSVKEMADTFAKVNNIPLPYKFVSRRAGDVPEYYADTQLAEQALGWKAKLGVERMCQDSWRWQSQNPNGY
jgi:UDP-glucose 4-epimerase